MGAGVLLLGGSLAGKAGIHFYKAVKAGNAFASSPAALGNYYHGGFERTMNRREAGLILGVR